MTSPRLDPPIDKRFRVAFSFAGEKRTFVAKAAHLLAQRFGEDVILYDKYHEAEFARRDLGIYLPDLYNKQADLVVVVVCPDYSAKQWTGLEWTAIHDLLSQRKDEEVMLCRFGHAEVAGLYSTAGFVELDDKTAEEFAHLIFERLALNEAKSRDFYKTTINLPIRGVPTSVPNNLPRLQPFFGRHDELKTIRDALKPETRTWGVLIDGPGGMGKTSLAIRSAYDCTLGQFDRIIFISIKDRELDDDGERKLTGFILPDLLAILNELARELGRPDIVKSPEDQRIQLLLEALRLEKALLLLDNLESLPKHERDQLFTFVRRLPHGCKAILTSRRRLGSGSESLILEKLDEGAALETLADLSRHNPLLAKTSITDRQRLYEQTGGKPLLLRWVAGQLGRGSCRSVNDALEFLESCPENNDPLEFIFGDLAREFTDAETFVLTALTYFEVPARIRHISAVADIDTSTTDNALRGLANRSLVIPNQEETTFALVPLVSEFLRRHRPDVIVATGTRLADRAYALILENGEQAHERFPILEEAWPIVAPALSLFLGGDNARLQTVCGALRFFFEFVGRWDEWLSLERQAEERAIAKNDFFNAGWRAFQGGWVHYLRGEADQVLYCAERAQHHWQAAGTDASVSVVAIRLRGIAYELKGDLPAAIATYQKVIEIWRATGSESSSLARSISDLADAQRQSGALNEAEQNYREALRIARALGDNELKAGVPLSLCLIAIQKKDWGNALILGREALLLSEKLGRRELIAASSLQLARAFIGNGSQNEARSHAQRAVEVYTQLNHPAVNRARQVWSACGLIDS
jgi:tetratricopeptide (TPR) repeat protein